SWRLEWEREPIGRHYTAIKQGCPKISYKPTISKTRRSAQAAYIQLLVNKGYFLSFLYDIGKIDSPLCPLCGYVEKQTPGHLLLRCPEFENPRKRLRKAVR